MHHFFGQKKESGQLLRIEQNYLKGERSRHHWKQLRGGFLIAHRVGSRALMGGVNRPNPGKGEADKERGKDTKKKKISMRTW